MTSLLAGGVAAAIAAIAIWIALARAKQAGAADQAAKLARETEAAIHEVQAEDRDNAETIDRLNKGTF